MGITGLRKVRFGDFEVDLVTCELRKFGTRIKLQDQPFKVLSALLDRPGEIISREELQEKVWPANTFVDFDQSLNKAINKIREALNDSAEGPRFVETLPRRGYRFIAPVERTQPAAATESGRRGRVRRLWRRWALALATPAALIGFALWRAIQPPELRITGSEQITHDGRAKEPGMLVSDRSRLYFSEDQAYHWNIMRVPVTGGETVQVRTELSAEGKEAHVLDVSRRTNDVLVAATTTDELDMPLWLVPAAGGLVQRLGDMIAHAAAWSPDGQRLAYSTGWDLYVANADGSQSRKIATLGVGGVPFFIRWSPEASRLRFHLFESATKLDSVWEIGVDGRGLRRVIPSWTGKFDGRAGCWTRDGKWFLFLSSREDTNHIFAIPEGTGSKTRSPIQLTFGPIGYSALAPGDDGRRLYTIGQLHHGELVRYDVLLHEFAPFLSGQSIDMVDFSPTGEWMTYVTYPKAVLWRSKLDGSQQLQLSPVGMQVHLPRWSPDARLIAFSGKESRRRWRIYTVSAEGGDPQPLLSEYRTAADVNWSPDGNRLIFAPFPWMEDPAGVHISVVDLRDKQVSTIPAPEGLYSPRWSPDGNFILALGRSKQLMLGNLITQQWAEIDHGPTAFPQWSRDGKFLYFLRVMGDVGIFRMRLADRKAERVVEMKAIQSVSYWFGLTPDGSVLMMRELGSEEIYALDLAR